MGKRTVEEDEEHKGLTSWTAGQAGQGLSMGTPVSDGPEPKQLRDLFFPSLVQQLVLMEAGHQIVHN